MKFLQIITLGVSATLFQGCNTAPKNNAAISGITAAIKEASASLEEFMAMPREATFDLVYCTASYRWKNMRWPIDYADLTEFVEKSDGYLKIIGNYERVTFAPITNGCVEI